MQIEHVTGAGHVFLNTNYRATDTETTPSQIKHFHFSTSHIARQTISKMWMWSGTYSWHGIVGAAHFHIQVSNFVDDALANVDAEDEGVTFSWIALLHFALLCFGGYRNLCNIFIISRRINNKIKLIGFCRFKLFLILFVNFARNDAF